MSRLEGKAALITGGARGQGAAAARIFSNEGAAVVVADVLDDEGTILAAQLGGRSCYQHLDVRNQSEWEAAVGEAEARFGRLDILVNNAGITRAKGVEQTSEEEWESINAVNLKGAWLGMRAAAPAMRRAGGGAIVNVASVYGLVGSGSSTAYHASKGGLLALTRTAAAELAPVGIRVNAVLPGVIDTPMLADIRPTWLQKLLDHTPLGRIGQPEEVATAVLYLASDEAAYITGALLPVDGGYTAV